jgi:hypothetical protein
MVVTVSVLDHGAVGGARNFVFLTITHRLFRPKVMQRTDCRLRHVLFAS